VQSSAQTTNKPALEALEWIRTPRGAFWADHRQLRLVGGEVSEGSPPGTVAFYQTLFIPGVTLVTLALLFGAYMVDGIFNVIASFRSASHHWALLIEGLIGIPNSTATTPRRASVHQRLAKM
jgi:hypothetical protein